MRQTLVFGMESLRSPFGVPSAVLQWKAEERPKGLRRDSEEAPKGVWYAAGSADMCFC